MSNAIPANHVFEGNMKKGSKSPNNGGRSSTLDQNFSFNVVKLRNPFAKERRCS